MKKIISIIVLVLFAIIILFFMFNNKKIDLSESTFDIYSGDDYKLEIIKHTNTSIDYKIINNTSKEVYTTEEFYIEKYKDGKWYSYNVAASFNELAAIIKDQYENAVDFELIYGNLEKGKYRFIKVVDSKYLSCEFTIK